MQAPFELKTFITLACLITFSSHSGAINYETTKGLCRLLKFRLLICYKSVIISAGIGGKLPIKRFMSDAQACSNKALLLMFLLHSRSSGIKCAVIQRDLLHFKHLTMREHVDFNLNDKFYAEREYFILMREKFFNREFLLAI